MTHGIKTNPRPSCYNREPFKPYYYGFTRRYFKTSQFAVQLERIAHTMTKDCQVSKAPLPECAGCKHIEASKEFTP